jgi:hypothetical protein
MPSIELTVLRIRAPLTAEPPTARRAVPAVDTEGTDSTEALAQLFNQKFACPPVGKCCRRGVVVCPI